VCVRSRDTWPRYSGARYVDPLVGMSLFMSARCARRFRAAAPAAGQGLIGLLVTSFWPLAAGRALPPVEYPARPDARRGNLAVQKLSSSATLSAVKPCIMAC